MNQTSTFAGTGHDWEIELNRESGSPLYAQLADAVEQAIESGSLKTGDRLSPHHELAAQLEVNIATVTKAISVLKQKGLVDSRPGRGTLIRDRRKEPEPPFQTAPAQVAGLLDLSVNRPATSLYRDYLTKLLPTLSRDERYATVEDYQNSEGPFWARTAGSLWITRYGPAVDAERVLITEGAQHALACALSAITEAGDVVLADAVTYQGISALCHTLNLELRGVAGDRGGMSPELLDVTCRETPAKVLFLVPGLHNPTTITLTEERRRELLKVAQRHDLLIVEDDVYAPLIEKRPVSFAALDPERTVYISGLSKCVAPGLRAGFVAPPQHLVPDLAAAIRIDCWSVSPLTCLIAARMIEDGSAQAVVEGQKKELRHRNAIAREVMRGLDLHSQSTSTHAWLVLPEPWRGTTFTSVALRHGVRVMAAVAFTVGRAITPHAVRLNLAAARSRADLRQALEILRDLAVRGHHHLHDII